MRKFATILLTFSLMLFLSVTASHARLAGCDDGTAGAGGARGAAGTADPRTATGGGGVWGMMERQSDAMRTRDGAYGSETFKRTDPSAGVSCFDLSMAQTSRLGQIFSDVVNTTGIAADAGSAIFGGSSTYGFNTTNPLGMMIPLARALDDMNSSTLDRYLGVFQSAPLENPLTALLGSLAGNYLDGLVNTVMGLFAGPLATIATISGLMGDVMTAMTAIQALLNSLNVSNPTAFNFIIAGLGALIAALNAAVAAAVAAVTNFINLIMSYIRDFFSPTGPQSDQSSMRTGGTSKCNRQGPYWNKTMPTAPPTDILGNILLPGNPIFDNLRSIVGSGPQEGTPVFSLPDLIRTAGISTATLPPGMQGQIPPGLLADLQQFFQQNTGNNNTSYAALQSVLQDLRDFGAGPQTTPPASLPAWTTPPFIPTAGSSITPRNVTCAIVTSCSPAYIAYNCGPCP